MNALLVVDRDADLCAEILNFFRNIGYVASRAADFGGALAQLRERAYDVVLCSVDLSGGAVAELIHAARQADPPAASLSVRIRCRQARQSHFPDPVQTSTALSLPSAGILPWMAL